MRPDVCPFLSGKLKAKILWKTIRIAFYSLIERFRRDAVDCGKIGIKQHALAADFPNGDVGWRVRFAWGGLLPGHAQLAYTALSQSAMPCSPLSVAAFFFIKCLLARKVSLRRVAD